MASVTRFITTTAETRGQRGQERGGSGHGSGRFSASRLTRETGPGAVAPRRGSVQGASAQADPATAAPTLKRMIEDLNPACGDGPATSASARPRNSATWTGWIRRRLRCALWTQWKTRATVPELRARGVVRKAFARSRGTKGPWRLSAPALHRALPNRTSRTTQGSPRHGDDAPAQSAEPPCTDPYARWCGRGGPARPPLSRLTRVSSSRRKCLPAANDCRTASVRSSPNSCSFASMV